jgi:hypothetical protein
LIDATHDLRVAVLRGLGGLPGFPALKGNALLAGQDWTRRPSWLMSPAIPSAAGKSAGLAGLRVEIGRSCPAGLDVAGFVISRRWPRVNVGGWPPLCFG